MRSKVWSLAIAVVFCLALSIVSSAAEPEKLVFMFRGGTQQEEVVKYWISQYEERNPGVKIEWQIPPSDWATKLPVWVATGTGPDVIEMWGAESRDWGEQGVLLDLAPLVKRDFTNAV